MTQFFPEEYDAWHKTPLGNLCYGLEKEAVFTLFKPNGLVLDVGSGTGNYTLELARQGIKAVGIDSSFEMARFAKAKAEKNGLKAYFVVGNAETLPFKKGVFDGIIEVTSLCFVADPESAIAEMKQVLKTGGVLTLGELNSLSYWALFRRIKAFVKKSSYRGARFFSLSKLKKLVEEAGFKRLKWSSCLYFPPIDSQWFLKSWNFFEVIGKKLFPKNGAFVKVTGIKS